jgi:hypothetical protein
MSADLDIWAAIEAAANANDPRLTSLNIGRPSVVSVHREKHTANVIRRFLEACPEDCSVRDLLESLEGVHG